MKRLSPSLQLRFIILVVGITSILLNLQNVSAQNVLNYHPLAKALALGKSFDLFNPSNAFANDLFSSFDTQRSGSVSQQVYVSVVDSKQSYEKTMHIDASMEASFISLFHAEGSYSQDASQLYSANSMTICIAGEADYGDFRVSNPVLSPLANQLVNNAVGFKQRFGEFYVSSVKRMQSLYVFITLNNINQVIKQQISAQLGGGGGVAIFSADLQGRVNQIVQQFYSMHAVQIRVQSFGKNNLTDLPITAISSDFFANGTFSANTYAAILKYIDANFKPEYGSDVQYSYSPLSQFGYRDDIYFEKIGRKFEKYIDLCTEYIQYLNLKNETMQALNGPAINLVTSADQSILTVDKTKIQKRFDDLTDAMADCRQNSCEKMSECCNVAAVDNPIDQNQLDQLRNRYVAPLNDLASFQVSNPTRYDFQYVGGATRIEIFAKHSDSYSRLNISDDNQHNYMVQTAIDFLNGSPGKASFIFTTFINGYPMGSMPIDVDGNSIGHYYFNSDLIPVGKTFNGRLPEDVVIRIDLAGYAPVPGAKVYITLEPYSRLIYNFQ